MHGLYPSPPLPPDSLIPQSRWEVMKYTQYYCTAGDASGSSVESNLTESTVEQVRATCYCRVYMVFRILVG